MRHIGGVKGVVYMQTKFFANDGTEFNSASACQAYERELYEKAVNKVPLER